jgi:beta-lactamase regulating signal transducer with metallopeptidase domain/uncharacterized GH25 family protein
MFALSLPWWAIAVDASLKAVLLALLAAAALRLLRLADASVRHRVWSGVLLGMLVLPVLSRVVPALQIRLPAGLDRLNMQSGEPQLPPGDRLPSIDEQAASTEGTLPVLGTAYSVPNDDPRPRSTDASPPGGNLWQSSARAFPPSAPHVPPSAVAQTPSSAPAQAQSVASPHRPQRSFLLAPFVRWLLIAWAAGTLALAARLLAGLWLAQQLVRHSRRIDQPEIPPGVRESDRIRVPLTVGALHPHILLPRTWRSWPPAKLAAVLAHERMHIERGDPLAALLAELNRCVYWFHPLAWWLRQHLAQLAETACDDAVIGATGDRTAYARHLLEVAASVSPTRGRLAPIGVSMARRSNVESRILAILDFSRPLSRRLSWRATLALAAVMTPLILLAAALKLSAGQQPPGSQAPAQVVERPDPVVKPSSERSPPPDRRSPGSTDSGDLQSRSLAGSDDPHPTEPSAGEETREEEFAEPKLADKTAGDKPGKPAAERIVEQAPVAAAAAELRGRVVDARQKPIAGARLTWFRARVPDLNPMPPRLIATTDAAGDFSFAWPPSDLHEEDESPAWHTRDYIIVSAKGHGFVSTTPDEIARPNIADGGLYGALKRAFVRAGTKLIELPKAGEPIRGRFIDIDGQPVAGASVKIRWFDDLAKLKSRRRNPDAKGPNAEWQEAVNELLRVIEPVQLRDCLPTATTDAAGRFELKDVGENRLFRLLVQGERTEAVNPVVRNQPGDPITIPPERNFRDYELTLYPLDFVRALGPSRPLTGRVLDLDSGEPIGGAVVRTYRVHGSNLHSSRGREEFSARTDAEGRYRIVGLPSGDDNRLVAFTLGDVPYIPIGHVINTAKTDKSGKAGKTDRIEQDFRLKRGVWATGRVYDADTNEPFAGEISYFWFRDRQLERDIPGLFYQFIDERYFTNRQGEFRVPVLPARGILGFRYQGGSGNRDQISRFPRGAGADSIEGSEPIGSLKHFPTLPHYMMPVNYERVAEVSPKPGDESVRVNLPLFASQPLKIRVVDAEGNLVPGCSVQGANERSIWQRMPAATFAIEDLRPGEPRKVFAFHRLLNLAGGVIARHGDAEPIEIKLVPAGSITGRLLDNDGEPITSATVNPNYDKVQSDDETAIWADHPKLNSNPTQIPVDENGRFRLDGLIPGWSYSAYATGSRKINGQSFSNYVIGTVFSGVRIEPGETKDIGDVRLSENDN